MRVNKQMREKWLQYRHKGDAELIAQKANVSPITVYRAYRGSASPELAQVMNEFYFNRINQINQIPCSNNLPTTLTERI